MRYFYMEKLSQDFLYERFSNIPVAVNNLYGDPFLPNQTEDTFQRLNRLANTKHKGIVAIITKSEISEKEAERLAFFIQEKHLNIIVLVSVSGLPQSIEPVRGNRLETLRLCHKHHIPCIAYFRPFIPNENTSYEKIQEVFSSIKDTGTNNLIVSGLRGNDEILKKLHFSKQEMNQWSLRVKIIPRNIGEALALAAKETNIHVFSRTSCGVAYTLQETRSYNPYFASPLLAGCSDCPLRLTCFQKQREFSPTEEDIALLRFLGYDASIVNQGRQEICSVVPENRLKCKSCCTSCFKLTRTSIEIQPFEGICLGDISFARLLLHKHVFSQNLVDSGDSSIARPKNKELLHHNLYLLNSWWSFSRNTKGCYGGSFCIAPIFRNEDKEYGMPPLEFAEKFWEEQHRKKARECNAL